MIVHIASDEKFINSAYEQFKLLPGINNRFIIIVDNENEPFRHISFKENVTVINKSLPGLKATARSLRDAELVCFHGLNYYSSVLLNSLPKSKKVLWIVFGTEFYNNPLVYNQKLVMGPLTYRNYVVRSGAISSLARLKRPLRGLYYRLVKRTRIPFGEIRMAMKRANYCAVLFKEEYDKIKQTINFRAQFVRFSYYPIENMVSDLNASIWGSDILLGNSASYTNNHLEAFNYLSQFSLKGRKVIVPLSYGDSHYRKEIISEGKRLLGEHFSPLVEFLPLHEYNDYLKRCNVIIMNHYRQQAVGNVLVTIWLGAKVFLDRRNSLFHYLTRIGVHVYVVPDALEHGDEEVLMPLTLQEQEHNRSCLMDEIGKEALNRDLMRAIREILKSDEK